MLFCNMRRNSFKNENEVSGIRDNSRNMKILCLCIFTNLLLSKKLTAEF